MQKRRIAVRGIIFKDGKIFAQKLKNDGGENDFWCTPGGGLDAGEHILQGLHREMIEETGVAPDIGHLVMVQQYQAGEKEFLEFFFHIKNADDYENIDISNTSHGNIEISQFGFVDPKVEFMLPEKLTSLDYEKLTSSQSGALILELLPKK